MTTQLWFSLHIYETHLACDVHGDMPLNTEWHRFFYMYLMLLAERQIRVFGLYECAV